MIKNQLFDTVGTVDEYELQYTDFMLATDYSDTDRVIEITDQNYTSAYWLGWVKPENVPNFCRVSTIDMTGANAIFTSVLDPTYCDFGYTCALGGFAENDFTASQGRFYKPPLQEASGRWIYATNSQGFSNSRFINDFNPNKLSARYSESCYCVVGYVVLQHDGDIITAPVNYRSNPQQYNYSDIDSILNGNKTIEAHVIYQDVNILLNGLLLGSDGLLTVPTTYINIYQIIDYKLTLSNIYLYYNEDVYIQPTLRTFSNGTPYIYNLNSYGAICGGYSDSPFLQFGVNKSIVSNSKYFISDNNTVIGNFNGSFPIDYITKDFDTLVELKPPLEKYVTGQNGNIIYYKMGGFDNSLYVVPINTPDNIRKYLALFNRVSVDTEEHTQGLQDVYYNRVKYMKVDPTTNEILCEFHNQNEITEDNYKELLAVWQYSDSIQEVSDYDPTTDKPEPETPTGELDPIVDNTRIIGKTEHISTNINIGNIQGASTFYLLTSNQVSEFTKNLWSSVVDITSSDLNGLSNFIFGEVSTLLNTGTLDSTAILNNIISLRAYPFDIAVKLGIPLVTDAIRIGSGAFPYTSNQTIYQYQASAQIIDGGTVTIPNTFNDYRDITDTTVTVLIPFCGSVQLDPREVIGRTLHFYYSMDVTTGECTCYIENTSDTGNRYKLTSIQGQMGVNITLSAGGLNGLVQTLSNVTKTIASGAISSGSSVSTAIAVDSLANLDETKEKPLHLPNISGFDFNMPNNVTGAVQVGSGFQSWHDVNKIYVIVKKPRYVAPNVNMIGNNYYGIGYVKECGGFSQMTAIKADSNRATKQELDEIKAILSTGFYVN